MAKFSQEKNIEIIKEMISEDGSDAEYGSRYDGGEGDVEEFVDRIDDNGINLRGYINGEETELSNVGDSKTFRKGHVRKAGVLFCEAEVSRRTLASVVSARNITS